MNLPDTNKVHQDKIEGAVGDNAKLLEERLSEVNWKKLSRFYFYALGLLMAGLFGIVFSIKLALWIFTLL
jgi:hypothetical protein